MGEGGDRETCCWAVLLPSLSDCSQLHHLCSVLLLHSNLLEEWERQYFDSFLYLKLPFSCSEDSLRD